MADPAASQFDQPSIFLSKGMEEWRSIIKLIGILKVTNVFLIQNKTGSKLYVFIKW